VVNCEKVALLTSRVGDEEKNSNQILKSLSTTEKGTIREPELANVLFRFFRDPLPLPF
jgi:hypothetical protein